jgi:hypothetical protein
MPFMMMLTPYHYWRAIFAWQENMIGLLNYTGARPQERKALVADNQTSSILAHADNLLVDVSEIAAVASEGHNEQSPAKMAKPLPPLQPSASKKLKQRRKNGSAKVAGSKGRRASSARA